MLLKSIIILFTILFILFLFSGSMPEPSNPPTANTGAPGETACMLSGCHNGGTFTGNVDITGVPDTVFVNQTYDVTITNRSNAVRSGFQLTVLDATNKFTGTLMQATGVSIGRDNSTGRSYARQSVAKFLTNGEASWSFKWKAPASIANENLTFYFSSLCANGDGNNGKDNSIKNTKTVILKLPTATNDLNSINSNTKILVQNGNLIIQDEQNRQAQDLTVISINGKPVLESFNLLSNALQIPNSLHGFYIAQFKFGQELHSEKIFIP